MVNSIIRAENLLIFLFSAFVYARFIGDWLLFIVLLLLPDISLVVYLKNAKSGKIIYNLIHNYALALGIIFLGYLNQNELLLSMGLVWAAHVGMDRALGFGLKNKSEKI